MVGSTKHLSCFQPTVMIVVEETLSTNTEHSQINCSTFTVFISTGAILKL